MSRKRGWDGARGPGGCLQGIWANWGGGLNTIAHKRITEPNFIISK